MGIDGVPVTRRVVIQNHDQLDGLGDDDHAQYALLAGRSGGQELNGGADAGDDLDLDSTADATKGSVIINSLVTFNADGQMVRSGAARTQNGIWIDANGIRAPGLKPATFVAHGITSAWCFADQAVAGNQEQVSGNMRLPTRIDRTAAPEFCIGWSADGISPGNCEWQFEYLWTAPNEDTTAAAQETLTATAAASATANGLITTEIAGIDLPSDTDMCLHFRITRLSAGGNDTIVDTVELLGVVLYFTSDKLGTAI